MCLNTELKSGITQCQSKTDTGQLAKYIKFIENEFNPMRGCRTLRLGSIDKYREFDATTGTGDPHEAQHGMRFGPGFVVDTSKDDFYESPLYKTGMINVNPKIMRGAESPALIRGDDPLSPGSLVWPRENFFIYCLTVLEDDEDPTWEMAQRIRPGANSAFEIGDIERFVTELMSLRAPNLKWHHFDKKAAARFRAIRGDTKDIRCVTGNGEVTYVDDLMTQVNTDEEFRKFSAKWDNNMFRCAFRKLKKYKHQKEYRIAFMFDHSVVGRMPAANCWLDLLFVEMKSITREIPLKRRRTSRRHRKHRKAS